MATNGINFARTFGHLSAPADEAPARKDKPKAQVWLNIGYLVPVTGPDGKQTEKFVSLPVGIPLDTMEHIDVSRINNVEFRNLRAAQNSFLDQLVEASKALSPGEECVIALDKENGLAMQLRRVNDAQQAPADESNPFVVQLNI